MKVLLLSLALIAPALPAKAGVSFVKYLEETAGRGEAESQLILGLAYRDGWDGTIKAGTLTARWCELADEQGDSRPSFVLGLLQRGKERIGKDEARGVQCLTQAARLGDQYAQVLLGEILLEGNGVPADWRSGFDLIRKSALSGFAPGQFRLGVLYLVGNDAMPRDDIEALAWLIVAADAGSQHAEQLRDKRTEALGRENARLAVKRSRSLLQVERPE